MIIKSTDIFHIHTYRCGHAEEIADEEYIKKAIAIGASGIWFTDHAPFPGNPFGGRMRYSQLDEYITTLSNLKNKYKRVIDVHIGLEIEYFHSFDKDGYYERLLDNPEIEILLLGQHMAETECGNYTFSWSKERLDKEEYLVLGNAIIQGIQSGYFDAVAHPDRIFRRNKIWSNDMTVLSSQIVDTANKHSIFLEQNESSKRSGIYYRNEFWNNTSIDFIIKGLDAHSITETYRCDPQ